MTDLTPKQAQRALLALDKALHTAYIHDSQGIAIAPTHWETIALFLLRGMLFRRANGFDESYTYVSEKK
jgi:hypothetical protein